MQQRSSKRERLFAFADIKTPGEIKANLKLTHLGQSVQGVPGRPPGMGLSALSMIIFHQQHYRGKRIMRPVKGERRLGLLVSYLSVLFCGAPRLIHLYDCPTLISSSCLISSLMQCETQVLIRPANAKRTTPFCLSMSFGQPENRDRFLGGAWYRGFPKSHLLNTANPCRTGKFSRFPGFESSGTDLQRSRQE